MAPCAEQHHSARALSHSVDQRMQHQNAPRAFRAAASQTLASGRGRHRRVQSRALQRGTVPGLPWLSMS